MILLLVISICILTKENTVQAMTKIKLNKTTISLEEGKSYTLKLKWAKNKNVKWSSSNKKIAQVTNGKIKALKVGNTNICAKYKNKTYRCKVKVYAKKCVLKPYQTYGAVEYGKVVQMAGYNYKDAILYDIYCNSNKDEYSVLYNLNGKYDTLTFKYGHVDQKYRDECTLFIYLDGELEKEYPMNAQMLPELATINVKGVSQLKIDCRISTEWAGQCGTYSVSNINFR